MTDWQLPHPNTGIHTVWMDITPETAMEMLRHNDINRPLGNKLVARLAKKMEDGAWIITGQGIAFSNTGKLVDGQHRLSAVIKSGCTVNMSVSYNLEEKARDATDVDQKTRTVADQIYMTNNGIKYRGAVAACARLMMTGLVDASIKSRTHEVTQFAMSQVDLITPFIQELKRGPTCTKQAGVAAAFCNAVRQEDGLPGPKGHRDRDEVMLAAMRIADMEFEGRQDPMQVLVRRLDKLRDEMGTHGRSGGAQKRVYGFTVSALRAALAGNKVKTISSSEVDWGDPQDRGGKIIGRRRVNHAAREKRLERKKKQS